MARTTRHPAWVWKPEEFTSECDKWWKQLHERKHGMPINRVILLMNRKGEGDGIQRNAPAEFRRDLVRKFRAKQNQKMRVTVAQSLDWDNIVIPNNYKRSANYLYW